MHPDLALVLSTSGSTGSPKAVRLSHANLAANAAAIASYLSLAPDDRAMTSLPMQYCYGLSVINSHLAAGAGLVLTGLSVVDPCFWDAFARHRATSFAGVPYTFELLDRIGFDGMTVPGLRYVTQAGGRMAPEQVRRYAALARRDGWELFVMYGQTEATARMAYLPPALAFDNPDRIGVPIPGGEFDIVDGELVYRGPNVMMGYASSRADLARGAEVDVLHTGDMADRTVDGLYRIVGRRSRFVKPFGLRVDLDNVERLLGDAVCAGDDTRIVVAAEADRHAAIRSVVRERVGLPASAVHCVATVPRLDNGKPDYAAMLASVDSPESVDDVAALFSRVLGCGPVRDDDTFVALGGDSLSYVEASVALERLLGDLPRDWHVMPVGALRGRRSGPSLAPRVETNVVVRAVAMVLIVASHTDWFEFEGGAHALLAVAGFNFARFQLATGRMWRSIIRIAVPSAAFIGLMATFRDDFDWPHALLVNGFVGDAGSRWAYWYIEAIVLLLVGAAALLAVPRVRRLERARPLAFAAGVLGVGLLVRFDVFGVADVSHRIARPHVLLWLFALGWVGALATVWWQRAALSAAAAVGVYGFFGETTREVVVLTLVLLLVWLPSVRVVRPLNRAAAVVAAASLDIYLTHWAVYPELVSRFSPMLATVGAIAVGVAVHDVRHKLLTRVGGRPTEGE